MTSTPDQLATVAVQVAREAAAFVRERRADVFGARGAADDAVSAKTTPTDPVTIVDTESEALIRARLAELRPDDGFRGEEGGSAASRSGIEWVVDPIDGTVNFLYGLPAFAISIAAQVDGQSVAGAVVDVPRDIVYHAAVGGGAWSTDALGTVTRLRCNPVESAAFGLVSTGFGYGAERRAAQGRLVGALLPRIRDVRRVGSAALDLCMVASGAVDAHYEHGLNAWDWAAGALVASEAGAVVRLPDPASGSAAGEVTVVAAPGIAAELWSILTELGADRPIPD